VCLETGSGALGALRTSSHPSHTQRNAPNRRRNGKTPHPHIVFQQNVLLTTKFLKNSKCQNVKKYLSDYRMKKASKCVYTLCPRKRIADIIYCNLKKDHQTSITLVRNFLTQLIMKRPFKFPPQPMCASALPGENGTHDIRVEMNKERQKHPRRYRL